MIKLALRHWIYEFCINTAFDNIFRNFDICTHTLKDFKVGDYVPKIQINREDGGIDFLTKCRVVYSKNGVVILESHDYLLPILMVVVNGQIVKRAKSIDIPDYEDLI